MTNLEKHLRALELDKILGQLAGCANCEDSRAMALSLQPTFDYLTAVRQMQKTSDAFMLSARFGTGPEGIRIDSAGSAGYCQCAQNHPFSFGLAQSLRRRSGDFSGYAL